MSVFLVISRLCLRAGFWFQLYQFLLIAFNISKYSTQTSHTYDIHVYIMAVQCNWQLTLQFEYKVVLNVCARYMFTDFLSSNKMRVKRKLRFCKEKWVIQCAFQLRIETTILSLYRVMKNISLV